MSCLLPRRATNYASTYALHELRPVCVHVHVVVVHVDGGHVSGRRLCSPCVRALTLRGAAFLVLGVRALPTTTITLLYMEERYYISVHIAGVEYELGDYCTASEAGAVMVRWLRGRGLTTALGSGRRLSEAQRMGACVVSFEVERVTEPATQHPARP